MVLLIIIKSHEILFEKYVNIYVTCDFMYKNKQKYEATKSKNSFNKSSIL